jgi:hypothetical protein
MHFDHLIFVGLNGYALALNRENGEIVWSNDEWNWATRLCYWMAID